MNLVYQTRWGRGVGNCTEAAVASIVGCSLEEVPDLLATHQDPDQDWVQILQDWLQTRGLALIWVELEKLSPPWRDDLTITVPPGVPYLVAGINTVGVPHMVVYQDGVLLHDSNETHETRGVTSIDGYGYIVSTVDHQTKMSLGLRALATALQKASQAGLDQTRQMAEMILSSQLHESRAVARMLLADLDEAVHLPPDHVQGGTDV